MSSRIIQNGKTIWRSRDYRTTAPPTSIIFDANGERLDCVGTSASMVLDPRFSGVKLRSGTSVYDNREKIVYRVVDHALPKDGWASAAFWLDRWGLDFVSLVMFIHGGFIDSVIECESKVRKYRCLDEAALRLSKVWRATKTRVTKSKLREEANERKRQAARQQP